MSQNQDRWLLGLSAVGLTLATLLPDLSHARLGAFGAEYGNIAENLLLGNGFAGPFDLGSEPTAWMPPLLPLLIAFVFLLGGIKTAFSLKLLVGLQSLFLWSSLALLMNQLRRLKIERWPLVVVFGLYLWANGQQLFCGFHDVGFTILLSCLALEALFRLGCGEWKWSAALGLVLPLASPALALSFGVLVLFYKTERKHLALVFACMVLSTGIWTARNAVVFHAFVPLKSNLWFDFHQANVRDRDGVPSYSSFMRYHPFGEVKQVQSLVYLQGEIPFMKAHERSSLRYLKRHPGDFASKIRRRFSNAFWSLQSPNDLGVSRLTLDPTLQADLYEERFLVGNRVGASWTCLDVEPESFVRKISSATWQEKMELVADWEFSQEELGEKWAEPGEVTWRYAHALLPTLAILLGLFRRSVRQLPVFRIAVGLYVLYLFPYIVVSHYSRYQLSLMGLMSFLIVVSIFYSPKTPTLSKEQKPQMELTE